MHNGEGGGMGHWQKNRTLPKAVVCIKRGGVGFFQRVPRVMHLAVTSKEDSDSWFYCFFITVFDCFDEAQLTKL